VTTAQPKLSDQRISFQRRPTPVPGDLRIAWRVALILVMLASSRSDRASLAKLRILNDAVRSDQYDRLKATLGDAHRDLPWSFRVEPAFARAIDFVVGEKLATWAKTAGKTALQLTKAGREAANAVVHLEDALVTERAIVSDLAKSITETTVASLLNEGRRV
jgi:hypothetical protein